MKKILVSLVFVLLLGVVASAQTAMEKTLMAMEKQAWDAFGKGDGKFFETFLVDEAMIGGDNGFLSRTEDGGHTWVKQVIQTTSAINDIYFRDKEAGFLIAGNAIFTTRDNGVRWTEARRFSPSEFNGADVELYSVRFSSKKKGWVVGSVSRHESVIDSILLFTDDAGETWQRQRAPSRLELIHVDFANDKRGWITGANGTILATVDAGAVQWSEVVNGRQVRG